MENDTHQWTHSVLGEKKTNAEDISRNCLWSSYEISIWIWFGWNFFHRRFFCRAVMMCSKAFKSAFIKNSTRDHETFILDIIKCFVEFVVFGKERLLRMSNWICSKDRKTFYLLFQMFIILSQLFHQICLSDPSISKLPIKVINCIRLSIHNEIHNVSFKKFGKRDHELSKDTFKTWWVYSSLTQEYMQILWEKGWNF